MIAQPDTEVILENDDVIMAVNVAVESAIKDRLKGAALRYTDDSGNYQYKFFSSKYLGRMLLKNNGIVAKFVRATLGREDSDNIVILIIEIGDYARLWSIIILKNSLLYYTTPLNSSSLKDAVHKVYTGKNFKRVEPADVTHTILAITE